MGGWRTQSDGFGNADWRGRGVPGIKGSHYEKSCASLYIYIYVFHALECLCIYDQLDFPIYDGSLEATIF